MQYGIFKKKFSCKNKDEFDKQVILNGKRRTFLSSWNLQDPRNTTDINEPASFKKKKNE